MHIIFKKYSKEIEGQLSAFHISPTRCRFLAKGWLWAAAALFDNKAREKPNR